MRGLLDETNDPPIRFGFVVIGNDSAVFGIWVKFVS